MMPEQIGVSVQGLDHRSNVGVTRVKAIDQATLGGNQGDCNDEPVHLHHRASVEPKRVRERSDTERQSFQIRG